MRNVNINMCYTLDIGDGSASALLHIHKGAPSDIDVFANLHHAIAMKDITQGRATKS